MNGVKYESNQQLNTSALNSVFGFFNSFSFVTVPSGMNVCFDYCYDPCYDACCIGILFIALG